MQSGIPLDTSSHSFKQLCLFKARQIAKLQRKPGQDSSTQADPHQRLKIDTKGKEKSKEYIPYEGQSHITHESDSCWVGHWPPLHKERQHLAPEASIFTHRQQQLQSLLLLQKQQLQVAAQLGTHSSGLKRRNFSPRCHPAQPIWSPNYALHKHTHMHIPILPHFCIT